MSQIGKEFFREWVATSLDTEARPSANVAAMLRDAEEQGITPEEIAESVGGSLVKAVAKAMAAAGN